MLHIGMEKVPVYILAGGRSSRFGHDKAMARLAGVPLLSRVGTLAAPFASRITVVAEHAGAYEALGLRTIADEVPGRGPLGGLLTALGDAREGWTLVLPCDLWLLRSDWIAGLLAARRPGSQAVVFRGERWEPWPGLYHASMREVVAAAEAASELTVWWLYSRVQTEAVPLPCDWPEPAQINTAQDLRRVQALLGASAVASDEAASVPVRARTHARHVVDLPEALESVLAHARRLEPVELALADAAGLVLAEPVVADRDLPPFDRVLVDGFAVRADGIGRRLRIAGEVRAGGRWSGELEDGTCVSIMTGAPCPAGAAAVVRSEDVTVGEDCIAVPASLVVGANLVAAGSECERGRIVAVPGDRVTPLVTACLATFGRSKVRVVPRPRIGIIATGDEIVPVGQRSTTATIQGSNAPMLACLAALAGLVEVAWVHAPDDLEELGRALAATRECDIVATTGGISAGAYDLVPEALASAGGEILFRGVRQRPGRPMLAAVLGRRLVLGLPGTPLAALVAFWRYVLPAARAMAGAAVPDRSRTGYLRSYVARGSDVWSLVLAQITGETARGVELEPCGGRGGGDIFTPTLADALLEIPPGQGTLEPGSPVTFRTLWEQP